MQNTKKPIYRLTVCAVFVALATVLSLIKIWQMPLGGALTLLSMLPIVMLPMMYGLKWGVLSAFVYSLIQLGLGIAMDGILGWGLSAISLVGTFLLDYVLAFTVLGFAGIFRKAGYKGIIFGTALVLFVRFLCHFASGIIVFATWSKWDNIWLYSLCYNGAFMLPELILTVFGAQIMFRLPQIKRLYA